MDAPYVIIGGDAAGMSAASKIMREQPGAQVIVFERSPHISYSACGMPYWIGGVIDSDRKLIVLTPEIARKKRGIDVRIHHEVTAISPQDHIVHVSDRASGQRISQSYSKLCIATGASAVRPPLPGIDLPGIFTLRALADAQRIHAYIADHDVRAAVVIGGGYIGVEMVEAMRARDITTALIEAQPRIMPTFDADLVNPIASHLQAKGVHLYVGTKVTAFALEGNRLRLTTDQGDILDADLVIVAVGVQPNSELAAAAGLRLSDGNAIWVDRQLRTTAPDIYAAGDCAAHYHWVLDRPVWIPLATSANKGGRVAGENMLGGHATLPGILGSAIVKVFDYTMAVTGLSDEEARASGLFGKYGEFVGSATIEIKDRAGYWPSAATMTIRLTFDKRGGRIVGCQMIGTDGVNKRIDIVATAITAKMTLEDVTMLDLSYAPPYSTSHDPIQVCASVAQRELIVPTR